MSCREKFIGNFVNCAGRSAAVFFDRIRKIPLGNESSKVWGKVSIASNANNEIRKPVGLMVLRTEKNFPLKVQPEARPDEVMSKYKILRSLGSPVPSTFRFCQQRNAYLISPVTQMEGVIINNNRPLEPGEFGRLDAFSMAQEVKQELWRAYDHGRGVLLSNEALGVIINSPDSEQFSSVTILDIFELSYAIRSLHVSRQNTDYYLDFLAASMCRFLDRSNLYARLAERFGSGTVKKVDELADFSCLISDCGPKGT